MTLSSEEETRAWLGAALGCDAAALVRLDRLVAMLREESARQNLVSAASLAHVWVRHLADSAQLLAVSRETPGPWLDLGSGAGFPGLVIAALRPDLPVVLVENRTLRIDWLKRAAAALDLANVRIEGRRLESVETFVAGTISARAFAPLPQLVALAARFSTPLTQWLLPKGRNASTELQAMPKPIRAMFHVEPSLTDPEAAILIGRGAPPVAKAKRR